MSGDSSIDFSVKRLSPSDEQRWDEYVNRSMDGTFFHLSGWRRIISECLGHSTFYMYAEHDGKIAGVLPLARIKSWLFGDALISSPFLVYGGPLAESPGALHALVQEASGLAKNLGVDYVELRNRSPVTQWPAKESYVTFRKNMANDPEDNFRAIPRKQRAVVRKAIKKGLTADFESDVNNLYTVLSDCKRNLGTPFFSRKYLAVVKETFGEQCEILTIRYRREVLSSVMSFRYMNEILPYYGGGGVAARQFGANDFMYWKVMEGACQKGVEVFDFGRSQKGTGAYNFKKYWGFEPVPLSYEYLLVRSNSIPQLDPSNKRYKFLINVWSKLPLQVSRVLGPPIARLLG
jgi:FemAB-related protein (PEP-CTERM system-associated)